ncbi:Protein of unknown function DUF2650 family-containing protein [Strongyloides ratti]|uniref:Uncharacterized protein n=1 Tax=Strongyloides ratti TaxID=34506 RepID=A0A090MY72_STRRB|nr:Protein of unknown function DUF2650 family-containing protein [Strongyloides ratti]CEF66679.1 Protein of unknown function DUF2650 family-containing protein [Strongyloides ratti]
MICKNIFFLFLIINCLIITSLTKGQHLPSQQQPINIKFDFFYTFKNSTLYKFEPYNLRLGKFHCNSSNDTYKCSGKPSIMTYSDCCSYDKSNCCIVPQDWILMIIITFFLGIIICLIHSVIERITYLTIP